MDPFGWRIASAVVGTLMVTVMVRLARRLTGSTLLGCVAGLLLCFDGLQFVLSRLALLDIFLAFFLLCAVACLVADRDWGRARLARLVTTDQPMSSSDWGPVRALLWRPWRLGAGVFFGLACSTKWNAIFPLAAFGILVWLWDAGARRSIGVRWPRLRSLRRRRAAGVRLPRPRRARRVRRELDRLAAARRRLREGRSPTRSTAPTGATTSSTTRTGSSPSCGSRCARCGTTTTTSTPSTPSSSTTPSTSTSPSPQGWLILNRPVGVQADLGIKPGEQGCQAVAGSTCLRQELLLGTPALWWGGVARAGLRGLRLDRQAGLALRRSRSSACSPRGCPGSPTTTGRSSPTTRRDHPVHDPGDHALPRHDDRR